VTSGLTAGDTVVVAGQQRLQKDGTPVRVVQMGSGAAAVISKPADKAQAAAPAAAANLR